MHIATFLLVCNCLGVRCLPEELQGLRRVLHSGHRQHWLPGPKPRPVRLGGFSEGGRSLVSRPEEGSAGALPSRPAEPTAASTHLTSMKHLPARP